MALAVTAAIAANVTFEHVTVTAPAESLEYGARFKVIVFDANVEVVTTPEIVHSLSGFAEMKPGGKVRVILLDEDSTRVVDVVKETVTDFPGPAALSH